jgi:phospholipid-translocating ATPase
MRASWPCFLEHDLELLGLTGVDDKLQDDDKSTLELLRECWDKDLDVDRAARCIAISTNLKLDVRNQYIHEMLQSKGMSCLIRLLI